MADGSRCPETTELAAFIDGRLTADAAAAVARHVADCDECRELVAESVRSLRDIPFAPARPDRHRPHWRSGRRIFSGGIALALAASVIFLVRADPSWWRALRGADSDPRLEGLVAAVGNERTFEGRLTGGFQYGPVRTPVRSGNSAENLSLTAAAGRLQQAAQADPSPENLHAWGVAQLLLGQYDEAVVNLQDAEAQAPENARYSADLAAALLTRSIRRGVAADLPRSLEAATRATELDPTLIEALFTRASTLERMNLDEAARQAWNVYLSRESTTRWADEARQHLARPSSSVTRSDELATLLSTMPPGQTPPLPTPDAVAEYVEDDLLPSWGQEYLGGRTDASVALVAALARTVSDLRGDSLLRDVVVQIESSQRGHAADLQTLATGFVTFGRLKHAYAAVQPAQMGRLAATCTAAFARVDSPMRLWCEFYLAAAAYSRGDQRTAVTRADALLARTPARYGVLRARTEHFLGGFAFVRGDYQTAVDRTAAAIPALDRASATTAATSARRTLAAAHAELGNVDTAWRYYLEALATPATALPVNARHGLLIAAGLSALRSGSPRVARDLFSTALREAEPNGSPNRRFEATMSLARAEHDSGDDRAADRQLDAAETLLPHIDDAGVRARLRADFEFAKAEIYARTNPAQAVRHAERALRQYRGLDTAFRVGELQLYRGSAALRDGNTATGLAALLEGVRSVEGEQSRLQGPVLYAAYTARSWIPHRELARFYLSAGRTTDALWVVDAARRSFGQRARAYDPQAIPSDRARVGFLAIADMGGALEVWLVAHGRIRAFQSTADSTSVQRSLARLSSAMRVGNVTTTQLLLRRFYVQLLSPIEPELATLDRLVVVTDGPLRTLPFAALVRPSGKYLIEDLEVVAARSVSSYSAVDTPAAPTPALDAWVLCEPANAVAGLPALPEARAEGRQVAARYMRTRLSCGSEVTGATLVNALKSSRLVHFAGHALNDALDPWASRLVVSPSADNPLGLVLLRDLAYARSDGHLRPAATVVVLAACSTAGTLGQSPRETMGFADAFHGLGVPWVIATQWDIEDAVAREIFDRFHLEFAAGGLDPATALRRAQLEAIARGRGPAQWAGVVASIGTT